MKFLRTRIKICGITRVEDGAEAVRLGVDAIGLVFYAPSPRVVTTTQARDIITSLPPFVTTVGLFVNASEQEVEAVLEKTQLNLLQFHGDESPQECRRYGLPYLKALRMQDGIDISTVAELYSDAAGILLDSFQPGVPGGTGQTFDWSLIPSISKPIVLAGGLNPGNVGSAIQQVKPYAVDVSGGVEQDKGIKDHQKMAEFINEVHKVV